MGIYDRDYYRNEGQSYLDRLIPSGAVCKWLILTNIVVWFIQLATRDTGWLTSAIDLNTDQVMHGQVWRLLTYAFAHAEFTWIHIFFNMLFLWWFGSDLEGELGPREFLAFYLICALCGGLAFFGQAAIMGKPMICLGASGAVTGILVLYAFHHPHAIIYMFLFVPVPIWFFVIFQIAQDTFHLFGPGSTDVAVAAHLGGAAFAALYHLQKWRILGLWKGLGNWRKSLSRPRLKIYRPEEEKQPVSVAASGPVLDEHLEAKLDAVLEKVNRTGKESLTEGERQILLRASEIYKKRRS